MNKHIENHHMIDILFVLSLFCVFAASSVLLIIFGADIYKKTVQQMDSNYSSRTSIAYITEKVRQADTYDSVKITSQNNTSILMLTNTIKDITYATSLYEYDGYLYELFARTDIELPLDAGQPVMELHDLSFSQTLPNLLEIRFTDTNEETFLLYVSLHSTMHNNKEVSYE